MKSRVIKLSKVNAKILEEIAQQLKNGGIAVIPTDTIYAITSSALHPKSVEKIYKLRKRASSKPMIILVCDIKQITDLGCKLTSPQKRILEKLWPNQISVVLNCPVKKLHFLHRGKKSLAFRIPDNEFLQNLLKITGPLVAPSANYEGGKPAGNIEEAKKYFHDSVSLYIDAGQSRGEPSTVAKIENSHLKILREGAFKIPAQFLK